jgi:proline iminopeptidase
MAADCAARACDIDADTGRTSFARRETDDHLRRTHIGYRAISGTSGLPLLVAFADMESRMIQVGAAALHVGVTGHGPDVVVLTGGPGCVQYLERDEISPLDHRAWYPEPRGVGRSGGGPHTMEEAIADLEGIREAVGVGNWIVVGHSWGCDLGVRYAVEHPEAMAAVVGIAGRGPQRDRTWSEAYEAGRAAEPVVDIAWVPEVHGALSDSFNRLDS